MRLTLPTCVARLVCLCCLAWSACTSERDQQEGGPGIDLGLSGPCTPGRTRCSADQGGIEVCNGRGWVWQKSCDSGAGQTCSSGSCVGPCDHLPSGSTGCSFYPVNLWSTTSV